MIGDTYTKESDTLCSMDMWLKDIDLDDNADINRVLLTSPTIDIYMNGNSNELPPDNFLTFISEPTFDDIIDTEENMDFSNLNKGLAYFDKVNLIDDFDLLKLNKKITSQSNNIIIQQDNLEINANSTNISIVPNQLNYMNHQDSKNDLSLNPHFYPSPDSSVNSENYDPKFKHPSPYIHYQSQLHAGHMSLPSNSALPLSPASLPSYTYIENNLYDPNHYKHLCRPTNSLSHTAKEPNHNVYDSNLDTIFDLDLEDDLYAVKEEGINNMDVQTLFYDDHNAKHLDVKDFNEHSDIAGLFSSFLTSNSSLGDRLTSATFNSCPNQSALSPLSLYKSVPSSFAFNQPICSPYSSISSNDISISPFNPKERKKNQNKIAAAKYRQKKKEEAKNVMIEESMLKESNILLKNKVACLVQEINMLKNLIK